MTPDPLYDAENDAKLLMRAAATVEAQQDRIDALEAALRDLECQASCHLSERKCRDAGLTQSLNRARAALASLPEQPREEGLPSVDTESVEAVCPACGGHQ